MSGALAAFDQAISTYKPQVSKEDRLASHNLAATLMLKSRAVHLGLGDAEASLKLCEQGISLFERLVNTSRRQEFIDELALGFMNKSILARNLGDNSGASEVVDQAIAILERLVYRERRSDLVPSLALAYMNKGRAVSALQDRHKALHFYDRAITLFKASNRKVATVEGCDSPLANNPYHDLSLTYCNKATFYTMWATYRRQVSLMTWLLPV